MFYRNRQREKISGNKLFFFFFGVIVAAKRYTVNHAFSFFILSNIVAYVIYFKTEQPMTSNIEPPSKSCQFVKKPQFVSELIG